jgi:LPS export ABC transporter protein LptC/lipopolysaccharide transport protein LptA
LRRWQRNARLIVALFAVLFAAFVAGQLKPRDSPPASSSVQKADPGAIVETTGGTLLKFKGHREDVNVTFQTQMVYPNGTSKLMGVTIVTDERSGSRTFTIKGNEGRVGNNDSSIQLDGAVRLEGSDGMTAATEHATYSDTDGVVRAPGPVEFARGRMRGTGVGMTWDKAQDILTILEQAVVHVTPDEKGAGAIEITSGSAAFARRDKFIRFEKVVHIQRGGQIIDANSAVLYLTADEKRVDTVDLHDQARISTAKAAPGALESLTGQTMNLKYADDGETLQHAVIAGSAAMQLAGEPGKPGRQIAASTLDVTLAPDGSTPVALLGREAVQLTFPPEAGQGGRTIRATTLDAKGEPQKGLTRAQFAGNVQFRERVGDTGRAANSATLDVGLKPGFSTIEDAKFVRGVHFEQGTMSAFAALAHYDPDKGTLALSGSEPGAVVPHVVNEKIVVDAAAIDITLDGPKVQATGNVRSELKPPPKPKPGEASDVKMPSMLKQDQPVNVLGEKLDYDGTTSKSTYTGAARLFQGDTSIKGDTIVIDNKGGNLTASGGITTTTVLETNSTKDTKGTKDTKRDRRPSIATAKDLKYDDADRRLTYTGDAHMTGPEGDMTAARIELYLKESGDELERAEAYEKLTLREQNRETRGEKMIYTTANETYVITGAPVKIVDQCQRETVGKTLTFNKGTDSIVVDGNSQIRTQTKGGNGKCS